MAWSSAWSSMAAISARSRSASSGKSLTVSLLAFARRIGIWLAGQDLGQFLKRWRDVRRFADESRDLDRVGLRHGHADDPLTRSGTRHQDKIRQRIRRHGRE